MRFPESSLFDFIYWVINTPGLGGIAVALLGIGIVVSVGLTLRWISKAGDLEETETYAYPTSSLLDHD